MSELINYKKWKSGRHDPELLHSVNQVKRFRYVCSYCMKHMYSAPASSRGITSSSR